MTRTIEYLPLTTLVEDPLNPKAHATATISDSITRFGYIEPIVLDGRTGLIISGHGRTEALLAARAAGATPPEGVQVVDGQWLVPVLTGWASRSDADAHAALIALNRTTELGGWQQDALLSLLDDLAGLDEGLVGVGYDEADIDALRAQLDAITLAETDDEDEDDEVTLSGGVTYSYVLVFDDETQLAYWNSFLRGLRRQDPDTVATIGSRVIDYLDRQGDVL